MSERAQTGEPATKAGSIISLVFLQRIELFIATVLLCLVLCIVFGQVVARFVFNSPVFWADELARYCYVWMAFVGGIVVTANRTEIKVNVLDRYLSPRGLRYIEVLATLIVFATCTALVVGSFDWLQRTLRPTSAALRMPMIYLYGVVWLSIGLMALHSFVNALNLLMGRIDPSVDADMTLE